MVFDRSSGEAGATPPNTLPASEQPRALATHASIFPSLLKALAWLGAGVPQGCGPVVLAADHGADRKPAIEEQTGHENLNSELPAFQVPRVPLGLRRLVRRSQRAT